MYTQEYLAKERHRERLRQAEEERAAQQVAELRKLEKRQERAERQLLHAWQRVEQLRSLIERRLTSQPRQRRSQQNRSQLRNPGRARAVPGFVIVQAVRRSAYPGTQRTTSARNGPSHSSWHSTPIPAVDTRWIST